MRRLAALGLCACAGGAAHAADAPICADRPAKANAVCTVPAGSVQVETAAGDWSLTRSPGIRIELLTIGASYLKLGVNDESDLEFGFTPYAESRTRDVSKSRFSGTGDLVLRYKRRLTRLDARVQAALIPALKLPTAAHTLGNGAVEGGVALASSFPLSRQVTITFGPELDVLANASDRGRHLALAGVINVSAPIAPRLTVSGEYWTNVDFRPHGTIKQASADAALAYALTKKVQLDLGTNLGLTSATPDVEGYVGLSVRF